MQATTHRVVAVAFFSVGLDLKDGAGGPSGSASRDRKCLDFCECNETKDLATCDNSNPPRTWTNSYDAKVFLWETGLEPATGILFK